MAVQLGSTGATIDTSLSSATIQRPLDDVSGQAGQLTKIGANTLTLTGVNTYTGDTTVSGGTLAVNGSSIADTNKLVISGTGKVDLTGAETVHSLYFGTTQQAAGTYSAADPSGNFTGAGTLIVTTGAAPANTYANWATTHGFSGGASAVGADGIKNLVKYALDLNNPNASYPSPGTYSGKTLTFTKGAMAKADTNIVYSIDESTDLIIWGAPALGTVVYGDIITYTFPTASPTKVFARLKVIQNP